MAKLKHHKMNDNGPYVFALCSTNKNLIVQYEWKDVNCKKCLKLKKKLQR